MLTPPPEAPLTSMLAESDVFPGLQPAPQFRANILLVDDRRDKLLALEAVLEGLGQNIVKATSGKEALRCLLKQDFAVILLDVSMPGMDGFETATLIRSRLRSERTPIIFVTAFGDTRTHVARGYSLGAVDYLLSPIVPEVLCTKVSVFVDLYKQTELIKRQAEELRRLNRVLENQVEALSAANSELEAFNYSIAHDLRAPLRSMGGFGKALLEDENGRLSPEGIEFATRIVRSTKYMDTLLQDLLAYSKLSRSEMPPEPVSVDKVVKETLALFEDAILDRHAHVDVCSPLGTVQAHLPTVRQIMGNLLDNALKFCPPDNSPVVRIYSAGKPGILRLWVEDKGIGIPSEHHERIFGLFRQLHHDDAHPGTGIGLAIVRRAAERMGGRAGVESELGKGSRFWVDLPVSATNVT